MRQRLKYKVFEGQCCVFFSFLVITYFLSVPSVCLKRKNDYKEREYATNKENPPLEVSFDCDHFGNFEPSDDDSSSPQVVCINDVL